ncbi:hypothetical protein RB195_012019 [Necator americanus]|uniref:Uncharacterized protein n=1 Tax=Necator americanus TaxID=51031 RepID=A0ABR1D547_NECAM
MKSILLISLLVVDVFSLNRTSTFDQSESGVIGNETVVDFNEVRKTIDRKKQKLPSFIYRAIENAAARWAARVVGKGIETVANAITKG